MTACPCVPFWMEAAVRPEKFKFWLVTSLPRIPCSGSMHVQITEGGSHSAGQELMNNKKNNTSSYRTIATSTLSIHSTAPGSSQNPDTSPGMHQSEQPSNFFTNPMSETQGKSSRESYDVLYHPESTTKGAKLNSGAVGQAALNASDPCMTATAPTTTPHSSYMTVILVRC